jgi:hypothetical protein
MSSKHHGGYVTSLFARLAPAAVVLSVVAGCDGRLPRPPYVPQSTAALALVGRPVPPARVEIVPPLPRQRGAVWVDGEWSWGGSAWGWRPGRWVAPPPGATYAPWTTVRDQQGNVYFAPGSWHDATGREIPAPSVLAMARPTTGDVVSPEGNQERVGPPPLEQEATR